jgi:hypothetical protein
MVYHGEQTAPVEGSAEAGREVHAITGRGSTDEICGGWGTLLTRCRGREQPSSTGEICGGRGMVHHCGRLSCSLIE